MDKINAKILHNRLMALQTKRVNIVNMAAKVRDLPNTQKQLKQMEAEIAQLEAELAAPEQKAEVEAEGQKWPPDDNTVTHDLLDPRQDLHEDSTLWHKLLLRYKGDDEVYGKLHALRCGGARCEKVEKAYHVTAGNEEWGKYPEDFRKIKVNVPTIVIATENKQGVIEWTENKQGVIEWTENKQGVIEC